MRVYDEQNQLRVTCRRSCIGSAQAATPLIRASSAALRGLRDEIGIPNRWPTKPPVRVRTIAQTAESAQSAASARRSREMNRGAIKGYAESWQKHTRSESAATAAHFPHFPNRRTRSEHSIGAGAGWRPASHAAWPITRVALQPARRRSRTPVSPSDLLTFCVADFMISGWWRKAAGARVRAVAPARICRPVESSRSSPRIDERDALQHVVGRRRPLIGPVAEPIANQQIAALPRRRLLLRPEPQVVEVFDTRVHPNSPSDAIRRAAGRDRGTCRGTRARRLPCACSRSRTRPPAASSGASAADRPRPVRFAAPHPPGETRPSDRCPPDAEPIEIVEQRLVEFRPAALTVVVLDAKQHRPVERLARCPTRYSGVDDMAEVNIRGAGANRSRTAGRESRDEIAPSSAAGCEKNPLDPATGVPTARPPRPLVAAWRLGGVTYSFRARPDGWP